MTWNVPVAIAQKATRYSSDRAVRPGHAKVTTPATMPRTPMIPTAQA